MFGRPGFTLGALPHSPGFMSLPSTFRRGLSAGTSTIAGDCSPESAVSTLLPLDSGDDSIDNDVSGVFIGGSGAPRILVRGLGVGLGVNGELSILSPVEVSHQRHAG